MFEFIEGDLSGLSPDELATYRADVTAAFQEHTAGSDRDVQFISDVRDALAAIRDAEAAFASADLEAEIEADLAADADTEESADEEISEEEDDATEADAKSDEDAELSAESDDDVKVLEEIPVPDSVIPEGTIALSVEDLATLIQANTAAPAPVQIPAEEVEVVDMSNLGQDGTAGDVRLVDGNVSLRNGLEFSRDALRSALMKSMRNQNKGTEGTVDWLGTVSDDFKPEFELQPDANGSVNFEVITASLAAFTHDSEAALTASVCCAPNDIIRDIASFCQATGLYSLPRIAAPHGGLTYAIPSHACGLSVEVFEWIEECDPEAEPQPDKPCQEIECGIYEDVRVNAFGWCFEYCNGTAKFNPEQLEYYLAEARCRFEHIVSKRLLDLVLTHPRVPEPETCPALGGSVAGDIYEILSIKFEKLRRDLCNPTLRPNVVAPAWIEDFLEIDNCRRGSGGVNKSFSQIVSQLGGTVQFVYNWQAPDAASCAFPGGFEVLIHAPGVFREVDGGSLDFGLVRDSVLNAQNKVRIAFERWNAVAFFGPDCSVCRVEITDLCPNGAVGPRTDVCETWVPGTTEECPDYSNGGDGYVDSEERWAGREVAADRNLLAVDAEKQLAKVERKAETEGEG